jgi:hypothetical protein
VKTHRWGWRRMCARMMVAIAVVALLPYAWGPIYQFPEPLPFAGSQFWNPYASLTGDWQRANLHAHGHAWGGLTSGEQPDAAVVRRYKDLGYAVAGVSDYQRIAAFHGVDTMPLYEHGFNVGKNHQLAIGARAVDWFDFLFWQTRSNQQYVIDRVRSKADLVSLNHPNSRDAYGPDTMRDLTGYQLIEVVNGPFTTEDVWDAALSAGRAVFAVGNDDTHDLTDVRRTAAAWNMIDAPSASTGDVVSALRVGRSYAVLRTGATDAANDTQLRSLSVQDGTVRVELRGAPSTLTFIGQDGTVRSIVKDTRSAQYPLAASDTYVRTVVTTPQATLFLNPVIRWNGSQLPAPEARVDVASTWMQRGAIGSVCVLILVRRRSRRAEAGLPSRSPLARRA